MTKFQAIILIAIGIGAIMLFINHSIVPADKLPETIVVDYFAIVILIASVVAIFAKRALTKKC